MEREPLTLNKDEFEAHEVADKDKWSDERLRIMGKKYMQLLKSGDLLPRQTQQADKITSWYVFELYSRGQEKIHESAVLQGMEEHERNANSERRHDVRGKARGN